MSESKHTPGAWYAVSGNAVHDKLATFDANGVRTGDTPNRICKVEYPYSDDAGQAANASLIAAAPDLLEALRGVLQQFAKRLRVDSVERARAAIAKAEGGQV